MIRKYIIILILGVSIIGCKGTNNLQEGQYLYTGAEIKFESDDPIMGKSEVKTDLQNMLSPEPNDAILGMRPKLWLYNVYDSVEKDKGFKHWVKYELGNPPVLLSDVDSNRIASTLRVALENNGFWTAGVDYNIKKKKKTANITYVAKVDSAYTFGEINLPADTSELAEAVHKNFPVELIKPGSRFNLEDLTEARVELKNRLKNMGFYYFSDTYILYQIDSTIGNRKINVDVNIKPKTPKKARTRQKIRNIIINTDFQLSDSVEVENDTLQVDQFTYIRAEEKFRPKVITNQIRLNEGNFYSREIEEVTISRLIDLGVFKYVNIYFEDAGEGYIDSYVRLSPMKKKSIRLELRGVTKSNSFVGPTFQTSFVNRNFLKGAELYELTLSAGYEWQIGSNSTGNQNVNSYELGINNSLRVPRFITPFNINYFSSRYVPTTNFDLGFRLLKRINFFQLSSFDAGYGFTWRETKTKTHNLYPIDVSFIRISNTSEEFDELRAQNSYYRRSYSDQFIMGANYNFIYNGQVRPEAEEETHNFYFKGGIDVAGNLLNLMGQVTGAEEPTDEEGNTIFGTQYSQFIRTEVDFRHYLRIDRRNRLASRIIVGVGVPYGNSQTLPYTKQFAIGGASSIRAFRARALGPGTFSVDPNQAFFDQTADIKLETNVEYRFDLFGSFKGAVFVDAGNIWTLEEDEREGGQFTGDFLDDIAVGTGVGVRLDIQFFVLRLDVATPVRIPSKESGDQWRLQLKDDNTDQDQYSSLVLNIAIGYPF